MYEGSARKKALLRSFRSKFAAALAVPMILLIISNVLALTSLVRVGDAQRTLSQAETIRVVAEDIKYQRYLTRFDIRQFVLKGKPSDAQAEARDTTALNADIDKIIALAGSDSELSALLAKLKPLSATINDRNAFQVDAIAKDRNDMLLSFEGKSSPGISSAVAKSLADNNVSIPQEIALLTQLDALTAQRVSDAQAAEDRIYHVGLYSTVAAIAISLVISVIIVMVFGRSVTRPLTRAVDVANAIANGDLTSRIEVTSDDELGQLLGSMETMQTNLLARRGADKAITEDMDRVVSAGLAGDLTARIDPQGKDGATRTLAEGINKLNDRLLDIVAQIKETSATVNIAAQQIAAGNSDLARRTEEQASSLEETASSMEQLTSTVRQNAENAKHANELGVSARDIAQRGGHVMSDVVTTMSQIKESATKIVEIISVIDGIAFQTNILALNAAVEAARAGEQGRGFAVVASEVRSLAQRSSAAAKEIKMLIGDTVNKVVSGSELVSEAGHTTEQVVAAVKRVTEIITDISAASDEQSSGIEQVNQAVISMDEVTQQNAALVEEAAAAAASLEDQSETLVRLMSTFKLGEADSLTGSEVRAVRAASPVEHLRSSDTAKRRSVGTSRERALPSAGVSRRKASDASGSDDDWETF